MKKIIVLFTFTLSMTAFALPPSGNKCNGNYCACDRGVREAGKVFNRRGAALKDCKIKRKMRERRNGGLKLIQKRSTKMRRRPSSRKLHNKTIRTMQP